MRRVRRRTTLRRSRADAALCVFGAPGAQPDHAARALRTARALHTELVGLADRHPGLDAGIGVASGEAVAGIVGAEERYEYTVIGDPVNVAARLTEVAKTRPGRVLANEHAVRVAGEEAAAWNAVGEVELRVELPHPSLGADRRVLSRAGLRFLKASRLHSTARSRSISPSSSGNAVHSTRGGRRGGGACPPLLPAIAAGEGVAGDALVPPDEDVSVDTAPAEPEARCQGKRVRVVRVRGVAVGRVRIARSHSRSGEEGGRLEGQAPSGKGWSGERDEHERPEADHEGLHRPASNTEARRQLLSGPANFR